MKHFVTRPQIADLAVNIYARTLHPELFEYSERFEHQTAQYEAIIQLTSVGHVIEFHHEGHAITEVLDCCHSQLPHIKRLCSYGVENPRSLDYTLDNGLSARVCFDCEFLAPEQFRRVEQEYWKQARNATLSHMITIREESEPIGLSFMSVDPTDSELGVHAFHLYPEESAILKTQSLFGFAS